MSTLKWRWNQDHERWGGYTLPSLFMSHFSMSCDPPTGIFCPGVKSWRRRRYLSRQLTAKLHIRASVVQVIQTLMKLCHSQIFHRGTTEWFGDGGNSRVCSFRGYTIQGATVHSSGQPSNCVILKWQGYIIFVGISSLISNLSIVICYLVYFRFSGCELRWSSSLVLFLDVDDWMEAVRCNRPL